MFAKALFGNGLLVLEATCGNFKYSCEVGLTHECLVSFWSSRDDSLDLSEPLRTIVEQLDVHQALVKQFAKILEFVLKFDEYKMMNPALQNDFSYYRSEMSCPNIGFGLAR